MSLVADELMAPAFGFSASNLDYPLVTHARGFAAHLVFGLVVAATVEAGWIALGRCPSHPPVRSRTHQRPTTSGRRSR
jgi:hypothetical protein